MMIKIIVFMFVLMWYANCHEHHDESASYKYSYEANKNVPKKESSHSGCGNKHMHEHETLHSKHAEQKNSIDINEVWLFSLGSTLMISVAPFLLLFLIPLDNTDSMKPRLKLLLAFASGGLLGDAFLHLIPHAIHPHSHHDHDHDHNHKHHENSHSGSHNHNMTIGLWVLCGIVVFLAVEKFVRFFKGRVGHSHGRGNTENTAKRLASGDHKKNATVSKRNAEKIDISGYLNLAADFAHNFTDGLAIGASYYTGYNIGLVTTMTILLHEVPHEIGDFAILIKSGCSRRKALLLQLVTALGAFAGNILALIGTSPDADTAPWFLPFTAGGFIYIATVSVLPELLEESTKLGQSIKEITALLTGVALMVIIANFE